MVNCNALCSNTGMLDCKSVNINTKAKGNVMANTN